MRMNEVINKAEHENMITSAMRILCKYDSEFDFIAWKPPPMDTNAFPILFNKFPNKFIPWLSTRHPKKSIYSFIKIIQHQDQYLYAKTVFSWWKWIKMSPYPYDPEDRTKGMNELRHIFERLWPIRMIESFPMFYGLVIDSYLRHKHIYRGVTFYEHLSAKPAEEIETLLTALKVNSSENVKLALKALKQDSQSGTWGNRGEKFITMTCSEKLLDEVLRKLNIGLAMDMTWDEFKQLIL